jgi:hypothetical protein
MFTSIPSIYAGCQKTFYRKMSWQMSWKTFYHTMSFTVKWLGKPLLTCWWVAAKLPGPNTSSSLECASRPGSRNLTSTCHIQQHTGWFIFNHWLDGDAKQGHSCPAATTELCCMHLAWMHQ